MRLLTAALVPGLLLIACTAEDAGSDQTTQTTQTSAAPETPVPEASAAPAADTTATGSPAGSEPTEPAAADQAVASTATQDAPTPRYEQEPGDISVLETPAGETLYEGTFTIDSPDQVFIGKEHWSGPADCSASAQLTVTTGGIDLIVRVVDDSIVLDASATSPHQNDSVEFYCDVRPGEDRQREFYGPGVFQMITRPGFGYRDGLVTFFGGKGGGPVPVIGYQTASERTADGYTVRMVLPNEGLSAMHKPLSDGMRLSIGLNDADDGKRETQMMLAGDDNNWQWAKDWQEIQFQMEAGEAAAD